jgi:hypothetical protein
LIARAAHGLTGLAGSVLGGFWASGAAHCATLPENSAEAMIHAYDGGGVRANGPALLIRKSLADKVSLSGSVYVDSVSNASIDVVTTASPFKETRTAYDLGLDYVYRDALISVSGSNSTEPDYKASSLGIDVSNEVFGGMTTVTVGFTRGWDKVGKRDVGFFDSATHWQYRLGATQILSPLWLASANFEAISDDGFLGNPYRVARAFGAAVPERNPRTRSSRAVKLRAIGDLGQRSSVRAEYRFFWDNWDIRAHTLEAGYSRYFGDQWLADAFVRYYKQGAALFYRDNATVETLYLSRNRQLGSFTSPSIGAKVTRTIAQVPGKYETKLMASFETKSFNYNDFTDIRTGKLYSFNARLFQLVVSATF